MADAVAAPMHKECPMKNQKKHTQEPIDINYRLELGEFTDIARRIEHNNMVLVRKHCSDSVTLIERALNLLYRITSHYAWLLHASHIAKMNEASKGIFAAIHKNQVALYSSLRLTQRGLHGPARAILRHVFEAQIIAKYCAVSDDRDLYTRWRTGEEVRFSPGILKKIKKPSVDAFRTFWGDMSSFVHATVYAQQVTINIRNSPEDIDVNFVFLKTLLNCQAHLLTAHLITPSMHYYAKRYSGAGAVPALKKELRYLLSETKMQVSPLPRKIIRNYCATWEIAPQGR
ncbi:hypothetical protein ACFO0J_17615 [Castellaniella hirudinis]|uniref:Uncharacterized protein n=1 Tax=Castellaniella hirudinis TaxID=1144617 RepID=A0ABV8S4D0_9BURK